MTQFVHIATADVEILSMLTLTQCFSEYWLVGFVVSRSKHKSIQSFEHYGDSSIGTVEYVQVSTFTSSSLTLVQEIFHVFSKLCLHSRATKHECEKERTPSLGKNMAKDHKILMCAAGGRVQVVLTTLSIQCITAQIYC